MFFTVIVSGCVSNKVHFNVSLLPWQRPVKSVCTTWGPETRQSSRTVSSARTINFLRPFLATTSYSDFIVVLVVGVRYISPVRPCLPVQAVFWLFFTLFTVSRIFLFVGRWVHKGSRSKYSSSTPDPWWKWSWSTQHGLIKYLLTSVSWYASWQLLCKCS